MRCACACACARIVYVCEFQLSQEQLYRQVDMHIHTETGRCNRRFSHSPLSYTDYTTICLYIFVNIKYKCSFYNGGGKWVEIMVKFYFLKPIPEFKKQLVTIICIIMNRTNLKI